MTVHQTFDLLQGSGVVKTDRVTLNNALIAILAHHYSDDGTEPDVTYPAMIWVDALNGYIKQRNDSDDGWTVIGAWAGSDAMPHFGVLGCYLTKDSEGDQAANNIRFSIQVGDVRADANMDAVVGRRAVFVMLSTGSMATPAGSQTVSFATGVVLATLSSNVAYMVQPDANGLIECDVVVSGAGTRYVRAAVGDGEFTELSGTWT